MATISLPGHMLARTCVNKRQGARAPATWPPRAVPAPGTGGGRETVILVTVSPAQGNSTFVLKLRSECAVPSPLYNIILKSYLTGKHPFPTSCTPGRTLHTAQSHISVCHQDLAQQSVLQEPLASRPHNGNFPLPSPHILFGREGRAVTSQRVTPHTAELSLWAAETTVLSTSPKIKPL